MGPMGQGPMTGRGMGWCSGSHTLAERPFGGTGFGMGHRGGWGRGWRHRNWYQATGLNGWQRAQMGEEVAPAMTKEQELSMLKREASILENSLSQLKKRIQEIDKHKPDTESTSDE